MKKLTIKQIEQLLEDEEIDTKDRNRILRRAKSSGNGPTLESKSDCRIYWNPRWKRAFTK